MRIVSLLPSSIQNVCRLGLGDRLVDITYACDYPPSVMGIPVVICTLCDCSTSSAEIDAIVGTLVRSKFTQYDLDTQVFAALQPNVVVTQALYKVCAISTMVVQDMLDDRQQVAQITTLPQGLSLQAKTLNHILETIKTVGTVAKRLSDQATLLINQLPTHIKRVKTQLEGGRSGMLPFLEWSDASYSVGVWITECVMMVTQRGCCDTLREPLDRILWGNIVAFAPEAYSRHLSGFSLEQTLHEAQKILANRTGCQLLAQSARGMLMPLMENSIVSVPAPRIVDSLELLAELVHPDCCCGWVRRVRPKS